MTPPEGNTFARVSPGVGFWLLLFAFALLAADALTRLQASAVARGSASLAAVAAGIWLLLALGALERSVDPQGICQPRRQLSGPRPAAHVALALGSLAAAVIVGIPLGILCHRVDAMRDAVLNVLNIIQTIPSIALFGILIAPLGWVAANVPGAARDRHLAASARRRPSSRCSSIRCCRWSPTPWSG